MHGGANRCRLCMALHGAHQATLRVWSTAQELLAMHCPPLPVPIVHMAGGAKHTGQSIPLFTSKYSIHESLGHSRLSATELDTHTLIIYAAYLACRWNTSFVVHLVRIRLLSNFRTASYRAGFGESLLCTLGSMLCSMGRWSFQRGR